MVQHSQLVLTLAPLSLNQLIHNESLRDSAVVWKIIIRQSNTSKIKTDFEINREVCGVFQNRSIGPVFYMPTIS